MFVEDTDGCHWNLEEVASIEGFNRWSSKTGEQSALVTTKGKRAFRCSQAALRVGLQGIRSSIPAEPGTYILLIDGSDYIRVRCVAWGITFGGDWAPLTCNGAYDGCPDQQYGILHPDGSVDVPEVGTFSSIGAFKAR